MIEVTRIAPNIGTKHYLVPVQEKPNYYTEDKGAAPSDLSEGAYIEKCTCHPEKKTTRYVEVRQGRWLEGPECPYTLSE